MLREPLDSVTMKQQEELLFSSLDITALTLPSISASGFTLQFTIVNHFVKKEYHSLSLMSSSKAG
jgi:hypothetical protein